jgi:hypothetical protein
VEKIQTEAVKERAGRKRGRAGKGKTKERRKKRGSKEHTGGKRKVRKEGERRIRGVRKVGA